ncbi:MAG: hypothetical protein ACXACU_06435 [Candidatus Hodarchaeales archaeon]|jgi:hypothetical protein
MKLKRVIYSTVGILFLLIAVAGVIHLLNTSSYDFAWLAVVLTMLGLFFLYKGLFTKGPESGRVSYGGTCKTCDEWCDVIHFEGQECCDCADDLPLNDRCSTCYEKSQNRMS